MNETMTRRNGWLAAGLGLGALVLAPLAYGSQVFTNTPPRIAINAALQALAGEVVTVTATNLLTTDLETVDPIEIVYTIAPDSTEPTYAFGTLLLRGQPLKSRDKFTQFDINQHRLTYRAPTVLTLDFDNIPFNVQDADGALASDRGFTVFSLRVRFPNRPPLARNGRGSCPIGGSARFQFSADNSETAQQLTFRVTGQGTLGVATLSNTNTGEFSYQANTPGVTGSDVVRFQVNDGAADSPVVGEFTVVIENQAPTVGTNSFQATEGRVLAGQLRFQDPDLPGQPLQVRVVAQPAKGTLEVTPATGAFTYTPGPRRFGPDRFAFVVSDGQIEAPEATAAIDIKPVLEDGELLLSGRYANQSKGGIFVVNPVNGDVEPLIEDQALGRMGALAYDPIHGELLGGGEIQGKTFLGALNLATGQPRLIGDNLPLHFPISSVLDEDGSLWVADGPGGVLKIDPVRGVALTNFVTHDPTLVLGVSLAPNGDLLVLDAINFESSDVQVVRIGRADGKATVVLEDPALGDAGDVISLPDGKMLICGRGGVFEFSPGQPLRQVVPTNAFVFLPKEMAVAGDGLVYILDLFNSVVRYNPQSGEYSKVQLERAIEPGGLAPYVLPTGLTAWRLALFSDFDVADPAKEATVWGDRADPDHDGLANLAEYALDTNPNDPADGPKAFLFQAVPDAGGQKLVVGYKARKTDPALRYSIEGSADLHAWVNADADFELAERSFASSVFDFVIYAQRQPIPPSGLRFFRLKIDRVNP